MKKFFILFLLLLFIVFCFCCSKTTLSEVLNVKTEEVVSKQQDLGFIQEEYVTSNYLVYKDDGEIVGELVRLNINKQNLDSIINKLGLMIINRYSVDNLEIIEGFSAKVKYKLKNRQANIQMAIIGNEVVIGSPIIYGSY